MISVVLLRISAISLYCKLTLRGENVSSHDQHKINKLYGHLHSHLPSEPALRVKAIESLLVEKGLLTQETIDNWVQVYSDEIGPKRGAQVVARAWVDAEFKSRLLTNAPAAIDELGFLGKATAHLKAVENTDRVHNLVVCTLCSCYPFSLLGMAPNWYKTAAYRSRAVREPRAVLEEFGVHLNDNIEVRVYDSTAELRYLVIPQQPAESAGLDEEKLAKLVSRNSMIGTERDLSANIKNLEEPG